MLCRTDRCLGVCSFFIVEPDQRRRLRVVHYLEPAIEVERTADRHADVSTALSRLVAVYERFVRKYPTQWYHFYDFFAPPAGVAAARGP